MSKQPYKIFLFGPQGSGKGTQATLLAKRLHAPAFSMGQLLRDEIATGSELGKEIDDIIHRRGDLVPDAMALEVLKRRLGKPDAKKGYVLDGYPRNLPQNEAYKTFDQPTHIILLTIPRKESLKRLLKRAELEGRVDDTEELINHRLDIYEQETKPMIDEYRAKGIVKEINGVGTVEEIAKRIVTSLEL